MLNITTFETLDSEIKKIKGAPIVLEALWEGDTEGWFLCLYLYTVTKYFFIKKTIRHTLGYIKLGGDIRVFSGGQWTEAILAKELGSKAVEKYNLKFYFPSDEEPDDNCPKWTEIHLAIKCADCKKLVIPTDSPYLPKDICYNCHLTRERNEGIKLEKPCDDGVTMYLAKNEEYVSIGYCSYFKDFPIAAFIDDKVHIRLTEKPISEVILNKLDIIDLSTQLENALNEKLKTYKKPEISSRMKRFVQINKVEYMGQEYELAERFNKDHEEISKLIFSIKTTQKAISENYVYKIYFKKGITDRDDTILRFVKYVCDGSTDKKTIIEHYKRTLTEAEVLQTINKLEQIECMTINHDKVSIKTLGKNIV